AASSCSAASSYLLRLAAALQLAPKKKRRRFLAGASFGIQDLEGNYTFALEQDRLRHEPPCSELRPIDRDILRHSQQLSIHGVVAASDVQLVVDEPVQRLARVLVPLPAGRF